MKCFRLRRCVNNSFLVFHQGTKHSKTIKHSRFALVFHTVFSCLDPLMKHSNSLFTYNVKYDPASRLKCTATLINDYIQYSRKSCHDEYEFKTVPFTISCCKLHLQFANKIAIFQTQQTPLLPLPESNSIYHAESAGSRDQPRPGSFLKKREEPGNEVVRGRVRIHVATNNAESTL
jgi:hypothetical protein